MALIKCPECKRDISDKAEFCPHCGCPIKGGEKPAEKEVIIERKKGSSVGSGCGATFGGCTGIVLFIVIAFILIGVVCYQCAEEMSKTEISTIKKQEERIVEKRACNINGLNIRIGPGIQYSIDRKSLLEIGDILYVLQEKDGWVRFRKKEKGDGGWSGWASKKYTLPVEEYGKQKRKLKAIRHQSTNYVYESLEHKLASLDAGKPVPKDDPIVLVFHRFLNQLSHIFNESEQRIADMTVNAQNLLVEQGISESLFNIMDGMYQSTLFLQKTDNPQYAEYLSAYNTFRSEGKSHPQAIGDIEAMLQTFGVNWPKIVRDLNK